MAQRRFFDVTLPRRGGRLRLAPPPEGALALLLAETAARLGGSGLIHVARSDTQASRLARAATGFAPGLAVALLPAWDSLPGDRNPPTLASMGRRLAALRRIEERGASGLLVLATVEAVLQRLPPPPAATEPRLDLVAGQALDAAALGEFLGAAGYILDERVDEPGEAALRGAVAEVFPADAELPFRLDLDGGRLVSIRRYDPLSQRGVGEEAALTLWPVSELRRPASGHWLERLDDPLISLFDLLPDAALALAPEADSRAAAWVEQVAEAREMRLNLPGGGAPPPEQLWLDEAQWRMVRKGRRLLVLEEAGEMAPGLAAALPDMAAAPRPVAAASALARDLLDAGHAVVLCAGEAGTARRFAASVGGRLRRRPVELADWWQAADLPDGAIGWLTLALERGFTIPGLAVLPRAPEAAEVGGRDALPSGLSDLRCGDLVVHMEHGIGRLLALEPLAEGAAGGASECAVVEYAGGDRLLVPAVEIGNLWRYGSADAAVALDRLRGEQWHRRRAEVACQLAETARGLLGRAGERAALRAPALRPPAEAMRRFAARFPFSETADQRAAIEASLADIAGERPMDRLVCGDVGFGKTEVALRAAAAAAFAGFQVALLAPTTVLVRQHLETFRRRFAGTGIRIEQLSRLAPPVEARTVKAGLADGGIAIVIGTHALTAPGVRFQRLGLVVIDEEQRFGARQKAALRRLRHGVHALTMTATPIPRTLQAALAGVQDVSVIATPPLRRQPVRTALLAWDGAAVADALGRERRRGGQSFVVCPRIEDLEGLRRRLAGLLPGLDLAVAHGRMPPAELDDIMVGFAAGRHDVLLSTNIIESGLDIPNANTLLVWRADRFGLAQLHQLRGRVGRGARRGLALLLLEEGSRPAAATLRRLRTLEALESLGAGFRIALRDLDMRGAGDLLGAEQAGHLRLIGMELYQHLLDRAMRLARGEPVPEDWAPELHLGAAPLIPADYVPEADIRLSLYREIAGLEGEVEDFAAELADRFGPPPAAVRATLALAELARLCRRKGVRRLDGGPKGLALEFRADRSPKRLALRKGRFRWQGRRLLYLRPLPKLAERLRLARDLALRLPDPDSDSPAGG